ncbi:MAG TPA: response regulator transcription factor [Bacteroidota bacterium]|nr:response regulator transcription factor [Bacteroidota bacterium]
MSTKITVLIADDHTILRRGLVSLLSLNDGIEVVGEAGDGRTAVEMALRLEPDVVLMDLSMPVLNGLEATDQLKREAPAIRVLILSAHDNDEYVAQVVRSGANGYVLKNTSPDELNAAIRAVHSGQAFFSPSLSGRWGEAGGAGNADAAREAMSGSPLTSREREVLQLLAEGETHQAIADRLFISIRTVDTHTNNIMKKLNLHDVASLVTYAIKNGIVILPR